VQVLVIGATKGTGRLLVDRLQADGHTVRAMVRDTGGDAAADLAAADVEVVAGDLSDAVAFCAGSGSSTGKDQTLLVDLHGAIRIVDAAQDAGVGRYVMLSSIGASDPWRTDSPGMAAYLAAKHAADRVLAASTLDWSIVRPGGLTHDEGTGRVRTAQPTFAADELGDRTIARADVAAVMAACLTRDAAIGATFELLTGDTPIEDAVDGLQPLGPAA
jgi:uncharacterized protein YbjT (DUF2867 family)